MNKILDINKRSWPSEHAPSIYLMCLQKGRLMTDTEKKISFSESVCDGLTDEQYEALESCYLKSGNLDACVKAANSTVLLELESVSDLLYLVENFEQGGRVYEQYSKV